MLEQTPTQDVLILEEACEYLRITPGSMRYLVQTNQIPYARLGKRNIRFFKPALERWLSDRQGVELHYPKAQARKTAAGGEGVGDAS